MLTTFTYNATCIHEQKARGLQLIGVANKNTVFVTLVDLVKQFEVR